jgi:thiol:disulfide interchange protein
LFDSKDPTPYFAKPGFRWVTGIAGVILLATGVGLLWLPSDHGWAKTALCILLIALGANALHSARNATEPWIAKIGPLP